MKGLKTKPSITEIREVPAPEPEVIRSSTSSPGSLFSTSSSTNLSSKSIAQQKEEAKFVALRRIYLHDESQIRSFVGTRFSVDDHTTSTACIMRLQSSLRNLPAFSLDNMSAFVMMRFSHIRGVKNAWHIDLMCPPDSSPFRTVIGLFHAITNLKLAFQQIFQNLTTKEPNTLIDSALAQWERLLLNQDTSTSFKHLRLDFIVEELMVSLCRMAQAFNDPSLDGVNDKEIISQKLTEATRVDEAEIMRKGTFQLITDHGKSKAPPTAPKGTDQPSKKPRTDHTGSPRIRGGKSIPSTTAQPGRISNPPCINNIQHLVMGQPYEKCRKEGTDCKYDHGALPTLFDSPAVKSSYLNIIKSIRNEQTREAVKKHLEGIPAKP